ncbi:TetR/AcrR family transcriptional regulator [Streptomyces sp. AN091965]|uniref:TetR/AcrR family transcriptional regulator n=1 Tax=Streptomyces sp. AN091965 TaxID=2927803 RepID=UPI001F6238A1|nr:helix-turn-helix domain-containing protein [Streptomyces sp. AN091965]MCI3934936.1 TetR/AcrR family transcriptional regulator [Streptomyces sp. AN091965]
MAADRLSEALDATYACLSRYGVRRTTVDDIAREMGVSRSAVYQYVRGKDDAVRKLAMRLHDRALARAEAAAVAEAPPAERVHGILAAKLDLVLDLTGRSPHAVELLDPRARLSGDICDAFTARLRALLTEQFAAADREAAAGRETTAGRGAAAHREATAGREAAVNREAAAGREAAEAHEAVAGREAAVADGRAAAGRDAVRVAPGEPADTAPAAPTPAQCADICLALVVGLETAPDAARLLRPATDALLTGLLSHRTPPLRPL